MKVESTINCYGSWPRRTNETFLWAELMQQQFNYIHMYLDKNASTTSLPAVLTCGCELISYIDVYIQSDTNSHFSKLELLSAIA